MGSWIIRWNFNKLTYSPGETASVYLWLENTGDTQLYISDVAFQFDFGTYSLESVGGPASPRKNQFLGTGDLFLPANIVGNKIFKLSYHVYERDGPNWVDLGAYSSDKMYFMSVYPSPLYRVFVSRGLRADDRSVGDPITQTVRQWGFETVTVGIEMKVADEQVPTVIREEIRRSDAVIAIATPRFLDALTGLWKTLEWCHDEVGIAYGIDKPLLILKDKVVSLGGLPSYLGGLKQMPVIEFDPYDPEAVRRALSAIMPGFRDWIASKRRQEFFEAMGKILVGGLAVVGAIAVISGSVGYLTGASKA
jgi:hypothetical protein